MTLILRIEASPVPQTQTEYRYSGGILIIGRGEAADWRLNDPDQYISRSHCRVSMEGDHYFITDASRGGLFVDGSPRPLGAGNAQRLENKMRLRLGDLVLVTQIEEIGSNGVEDRVYDELAQPGFQETPAIQETELVSGLNNDSFFSSPAKQIVREPKPEGLPDPFDTTTSDITIAEQERSITAHPDGDPFLLDPLEQDEGVRTEQSEPALGSSAAKSFESSDDSNIALADVQADPDGLRAAFVRGLGIATTELNQTDITEAEMEEIGRRLRLIVGGLVNLLRTRAREKTDFRVEMTTIGREDVNPLKFLPTLDEALASIIRHKGPGYLQPNDAIHEAFQDLLDHRARSWTGIQTALRRMIDRFDPMEIEAKASSKGRLKQLLDGGRSATLWKLYTDDFKEISRAAEDRFLGDAGDFFRDAYEAKGNLTNGSS